MYSQNHAPMAPPQKPETFMLSNEAQQSLPQDAQVALQQVDNRTYHQMILVFCDTSHCLEKILLHRTALTSEQSSTFSSQLQWTGRLINTFEGSSYLRGNMFLASYGESQVLGECSNLANGTSRF